MLNSVLGVSRNAMYGKETLHDHPDVNMFPEHDLDLSDKLKAGVDIIVH